MKNIPLILLVLLFTTISFGQSDPKLILDDVFKKSREISLYASKVNWDDLQKQVYAKAENAKTISDLTPAFTALINGLRDHHGKIVDAKNYSTMASFTDWENLNQPDKRPKDSKTWAIVNDVSSQFSYKILNGNIGYLKIVGIAPNIDIEKESKRIGDAVIELSNKKVDK